MASVTKLIKDFARSPKGQQLIEQVKEQAGKPENRRKLEELRRRYAMRRLRSRKPRPTGVRPSTPIPLSLPGPCGLGTVGPQGHARLLVNGSSNTAGAISLAPPARRVCFVESIRFESAPWATPRRLR